MTALADGLLAIAEEVHSHPEAEAHSLSDWLTWLDEEGYDQPGIEAALQQLCQQRLGTEAGQQLQAQARTRLHEPQGITNAIAHLSEAHPQLLEEILEIEQTRQRELETIHATAGGVRWGKVGGKTGQVVLGVGIAALIIKLGHKIHTNWEQEQKQIYNTKLAQREETRASECLDNELTNNWREWSDKLAANLDVKEIRSEKLVKLPVRLSDQSPEQVLDCALRETTRASLLNALTEFGLGSEVSARLLRARLPKVYLDAFQGWATEKAGKALSFEFKNANDIPHDLRREFEKSEFAHKLLADLQKPEAIEKYGIKDFRDCNSQAFFGHLKNHYFEKLLTRQTMLKEIKKSRLLTAEEEEFDNNLIFDFSDQTMRDIVAKHGDELFRYAIAGDKIEDKAETWGYVTSKVKSLDIDAITSKCPALKEAEGIVDAHSLKITTLAAKLDKLVSEGKLASDSKNLFLKKLDTAAIKNLRRKVNGAKNDIDMTSRHLYLDERTELALKVESCLESDLKSELSNQLEDMDDIEGWMDSRSEAIEKRFAEYVMTDAKLALQDALSTAKDSARATEEVFKSVEQDLLDI